MMTHPKEIKNMKHNILSPFFKIFVKEGFIAVHYYFS